MQFPGYEKMLLKYSCALNPHSESLLCSPNSLAGLKEAYF